jgi:hypothetical protein
LFGLFTEKTPKELIEGYTDPLVSALGAMPIYQGGDQLASPFLSIIFSPVNTPNNQIAFFMGTGDEDYSYLLTRTYAKWLDKTNICIADKDYISISKTVDICREPWLESVELNGTDGNQFHPDLQEDE